MSIARWVGFGFEDTFGTENVNVKYALDPSRVTLDSPSNPFQKYGGSAGRGTRALVVGAYVPQGDIEAVIEEVSAGVLFRGAIPAVNYQQQAADAINKGPGTTLSADVAIGGTVLPVADATSFQANDILQVGADFAGAEIAQVISIDGATNQITVDAAMLHAHVSGDTVVPLTSGPYLHIFDFGGSDDSLTSMTIRTAKDFDEQVFLGSVISQLQIQLGYNALAQITASVVAQQDKPNTITPLPNSNDPDTLITDPFSGPDLTTATLHSTSGGTDKDILAYIRDAELTFNNNVAGEDGVRMGSRFPQKLTGKGLDLTAKLTLAFENRDQYDDFWGGTGAQETLGVPRNLELVMDKGTDYEFSVWLYNIYLTQPASNVSGRDMLTQTLDYEAIQKAPFNADGVMGSIRYKNNVYRYF